MTEPDPKTLLGLYNTMESQLELLGLTFEQFSVLYKSFRKEIPLTQPETKKEETKDSPFP